ncbi:large ribosomal subunit protein uL6c [Cryptomeria japonica]|uniref:large ribosomal subunit protein uL6c n=1 Tax=Cryptomeria japonica TaxID=3369 RepID=UPI0025ACA955|nr:large ribosomal subunit protein uL6c [Cryptomeria japonica]
MASLTCTLPHCTYAPKSTFLGEDHGLRAPINRHSKVSVSYNGLRAPINRHSKVSVSFRRLVIECKESRIGKKPVEVPSNVEILLDGQLIKTKGPLGELSLTYPDELKLEKETSGLRIYKAVENRKAHQLHGLFRTLTDNIVVGVSKGFERKLQLVGVGYRASLEGNELVMNLGFSHPVRMEIPNDLKLSVEENTRITITGIDKVIIGDYAAKIRKWRPPEPYKGKGIRYADERVRLKEGKAGKKK